MESSRRKIIVTLVHGTFAKRAPWTKPDSPLSQAISKSCGDAVSIQRLEWSGLNLVTSRVNAAHSLYRFLGEQRKDHPDAQQIVIGHSHGGSAIAYALKNYPLLASNLTGVAFLSTPFFNIRLKPDWESIGKGIGFSLGIWAASIATLFYWVVVLGSVGLVSNPSVAFGALFIYSYFLGMFKPTSDELSKNGKRLKEIAEELSTVNLPKGRYAFFRISGDEAAGALSIAQMWSWGIGRLNVVLAGPMKFVTKSAILIPLKILFVLYFFFLGISLQEVLKDTKYKNFDTWPSLGEMFSIDWAGLLAFTRDNPIVAVPIGALTLILVAILSNALVWICSSLFASISFVAFGRFYAWSALYLDTAVEPLPIGSYSLQHHGWGKTSGDELQHSATYSQPATIQAICKWIRDLTVETDQSSSVIKPDLVITYDKNLTKNWKRTDEFKISAIHPPVE